MPRILVLDDEPLISMLLEGWLTELGHEIIGPARSIPVALDLIGRATLDGAILDVSLGNEKCYPVADVLLEKSVPFAFSTGHSGEDIDARFKDVLLLSKPFDFAQVEMILGKLIGVPRICSP